MATFFVEGGRRLIGQLRVQGAKNSVLPILAGTIINKGISIISNCPQITDVQCMINILISVGCKVKWYNNKLIVDSRNIVSNRIPDKYVKEMRSSIIVMGAMLARTGEVVISTPGGCSIGNRPIDFHLQAMKALKVEIEQKQDYVVCKAKNKHIGGTIKLDFPSVGATENIMLLACCSEDTTIINNAAREPEIAELQHFLNGMGANIHGAGSSQITIKGTKSLFDTEYTIMSDRIVAGTYMMAVAATGGDIDLLGDISRYSKSTINVLKAMGCMIRGDNNVVSIKAPQKVKNISYIATAPYPDFPTDMQSQLLSVCCVADGVSRIRETIFEARFGTAEQLIKMGASIKIKDNEAIIVGRDRLKGANVEATDLRGGAALIIAGLCAEGVTRVDNVSYILRGYENIVKDMSSLGAKIYHNQ